MNKKLLVMLAGAIFAASTGTAALAQATQPIQLVGDVKLDKVSVVNGKETHALVEPKVVVPGDHLIFSTKYHNAGAVKVDNFVVTNPIPAGIQLSADGADKLDVSVDGGKSWGKLATLKLTDDKGAVRAAQVGDVTHVRWVVASVAPGASGVVSYNAIVR